MAVRLTGELDVDHLVGAIRDVVARHEVLRTTYPQAGSGAVQRVASQADAMLAFDWREVQTTEELIAAAATGFDVTRELPIRGRLRRGDGAAELLIVVHHIAFDGSSTPVLLRDVLAAYAHRLDPAVPEQAPLEIQYADYALWQRNVLGDKADPQSLIGRQLAYWRERLQALPVVTDLPRDRPRPEVFDPAGAVVSTTLDASTAAQIDEMCRTYRITRFMALYAALAVTVARLSASSEAVVAAPTAGRTKHEIEDLIGMFVNTLILRVGADPARTVGDLLDEVREAVLGAFGHADVQFDDLVEALAPPHSTAYSPLAQIAFTYGEKDAQQDGATVGGIGVEPISTDDHVAKFDLTVGANGVGPAGPIEVDFLYATALFDERTVAGFAEVYSRVVAEMAADQRTAIGDLAVAPSTTREAVGARQYASPAAHEGSTEPGTLPDILAARDLDPWHPALICDGAELSYDDFESRTNRVARALIARGVRPGEVVAIGMERSVESVIAVWGVVKSGAAYLAIDPEFPADRIDYMLGDSEVRSGIVANSHAKVPGALRDWTPLTDLEAESASDAPIADDERNGSVRLDGLAYVIYTSGSTGKPKGVAVSHRGMADLAANYQKVTGPRIDDPDTRILHVASLSFDASFFEMAWAITAGHTLVVAPQNDYAGDVLDEILERDEVTDMVITPSVLATLDPERAEFVRNLATAGEACPPELVVRWTARGRRLWNFYGPSETTVWATRGRMMPRKPVTIGRTIDGFVGRVLDSRLHETPPGVVGELYLAAEGLARGYVHRPALTATAFVADPYAADGSRMYRTGDLVRRAPNGELEYVGRADLQVKLRGQRVELGEIEAAIVAVPGVRHAAAAVVTGPQGSDHLVGYVSPGDVDLDAVREAVAVSVPVHMRPTLWTVRDDLPLNAAGKLDRNRLPAPDFDAAPADYTAPETDDEIAVAAVFAQVLGVERTGVTESFFDAGGNSLSAMRVVSRAGEVLGVELTVRDLFAAPSVRALISASAGKQPALAPIVAVTPRPEHPPLSYAQQRMWFINRLDPQAPTYNLPTVLRLRGELDVRALRQAVADTVAQHEVLRTRYPSRDGEPYQAVAPTAEAVERLDWAEVYSAEALESQVLRGFDLERGWPVRVRLFRSGPQEWVLALVVHHISFDGQSFGPMAGDLLNAYAARVEGRAPVYASRDVQYVDFAIWQRDVLGSPEDPESVLGRQLTFWRDRLAGAPDVHLLPLDHPRPLVASHRGAQVAFEIPAALAARIEALAVANESTRFMVLHAAFAALSAGLSGSGDVVLGTPIDGRGRRGAESLVGMFVNTLVLRTSVRADESFEGLIGRVRNDDLEAFDHADVPFESIVDALNPVRSEAFSPVVQVILSVDPVATDGEPVEVGGLSVEAIGAGETPAQVDLNLTVTTAEKGHAWPGVFTFATDLFERTSIEILAQRLLALLETATAEPSAIIGDIALMPPAELERVNSESRGATSAAVQETIADAVAASVRRAPHAVALVAGGREMSYAEFGGRTEDLVRRLVEAGIGRGSTVGVVMDRSAELVIAVHAIMAAGSQYVPIDVTAPVERAQYISDTAGVQAVAVRRGQRLPGFVESLGVPVVEIDATAELSVVEPVGGDVSPRLEDAAYTLFTSGSTGRPKGVTVSHRAVRNFVAWFDGLVPAGEQRLLFKTPHTFDASVLELLWPLVAGKTMVIADANGHRDPRYLADLIDRFGVTVAQFVPSLLAAFLDVVDDDPLLPGLHVLFSGGEALPPAVARAFRSRVPGAKLVNLFGPTEAAEYTMSATLDEVADV
ncbi:MAG: amino acid adenylation domain-containing protein, partial [Gordonia sp. (in: high G+C Gram-positive bacteria)]